MNQNTTNDLDYATGQRPSKAIATQIAELVLAPVVLRERLDDAIEALLDLDAWNHAITIEAAEVESMQNILGNWKKSISQQDAKYSQGGAA